MRDISKEWDATRLGDLRGKTAIVTGANSGIGYHTALELGRAGAAVVAACRDPQRGQDALSRLRAAVPSADFRLEALDLAALASVRAFAARFLGRDLPLDLLINNAGIMANPTRDVTADGFEAQLGTNHLGHFALTGLLVPALRKSAAPRVVTVSSSAGYFGRIKLDDLQSEKRYSPFIVYSQTKLANLLFMMELGRRAPWLTSVAAHPGATYTNLQKHGGAGMRIAMKLVAQQADRGALPTLYAAAGEVQTGEFYGPRYRFNTQGPPVEVRLPRRARDAALARALWERSEQLTGVRFDLDSAVRMSA